MNSAQPRITQVCETEHDFGPAALFTAPVTAFAGKALDNTQSLTDLLTLETPGIYITWKLVHLRIRLGLFSAKNS